MPPRNHKDLGLDSQPPPKRQILLCNTYNHSPWWQRRDDPWISLASQSGQLVNSRFGKDPASKPTVDSNWEKHPASTIHILAGMHVYTHPHKYVHRNREIDVTSLLYPGSSWYLIGTGRGINWVLWEYGPWCIAHAPGKGNTSNTSRQIVPGGFKREKKKGEHKAGWVGKEVDLGGALFGLSVIKIDCTEFSKTN